MRTPLEILERQFGFHEFRLNQEVAIQSMLEKKDSFVLMPTGGGKSLCYQIPALMNHGLTIVISPLISLMKDQVDALRENGITANFLNSTLSSNEQEIIIRDISSGMIKMLYIAPERLFSENGTFIKFLKTIPISFFAIDEAHCISQWGHDFRPEYSQLSILKKEFENTPIMALTATADLHTRKDIIEKLNLKIKEIFISSFNRPNIHYYVEIRNDGYSRLLSFLRHHKGESGIIYCLSRKSVNELSEKLHQDGYLVKSYHAGLTKNLRDENQNLFAKDQIQIIVATIAFGMGIDKSNVRFVVHMNLPKNIESYYQETGRAGRDGLKSEALLLYSYSDIFMLEKFSQVENNPRQTAIMLQKLGKMKQYAEIGSCRRQFLMQYFGENHPDQCGSCDICLSIYKKIDGTILAQKALSAVTRLNEKYGIGFLIDFLRGSESEKMKPEHRTLKTYGAGIELSKESWRIYLNDLLHQGYLKQSDGQYPVLQLTEKSKAVLRGEQQVMLVESVNRVEAITNDIPFEMELLTLLKSLRMRLAHEASVPAYVIFSDATLMEIANYLPDTLNDLKLISGFGSIKIEKYGNLFLSTIIEYCKAHGLSSRIEEKISKKKPREKRILKEQTTETKLESLHRFKNGKSMAEIAFDRNLSLSTIENHLAYFVLEGTLSILEIVSKEKIPRIEESIKEHGDVYLNPLKTALGDEVSYGEIRAVINHLKFLSEK